MSCPCGADTDGLLCPNGNGRLLCDPEPYEGVSVQGSVEQDEFMEDARFIQEFIAGGGSPADALTALNTRRACECCNGAAGEEKAGVASIPGVPMSILWCKRCITSGVIPMWAVIGEIAVSGGWEHVRSEWQEFALHCAQYHGMTPMQLAWNVALSIEQYEDYERQAFELSERNGEQ